MKKYLLLAGIAAGTLISAQVKVGDNQETIEPSAALEIESTDKGFLPPRLTTEQIEAIESPAEGLVVYDSDKKQLEYYNSEKWVRLPFTPE